MWPILAAVERGDITTDDMMLLFLIDSAQLYESKQSDCWIAIWIMLDHAPDGHYMKKCVLPGTFIPGPNKLKNVDSYLFLGLHHLAALQWEGLKIWDAHKDCVFTSCLYLALATVDGPGMMYLNGLIGNQGAYGCRLRLSTSPGYPWLTTGIPVGKPTGMETHGSELLVITGLYRSGCLFCVLQVLATSTCKTKIF
jgi:hypothetical protein